MKNIFLLVCIVISFSFTKVLNQSVEKVLVSGKWFVESTQEKGEKPELAENKNDEWLVFYADGKLEENQFGETFNSKWEYSKEEEVIKLSSEEEIIHLKIIEISSNKLVVEKIENIREADDSVIVSYSK